jgi:hypothetical protein
VYPHVLDGALLLGMMWRSRKAVDLLRDSRLVLRNAICTNRGDEVEVILRGKAKEISDGDTRTRYLEAVPAWGTAGSICSLSISRMPPSSATSRGSST